jgi:SAM-dependent methyltransferase
MNIASEKGLMRRVAGYHDIRLDGISDLVPRARGASVLDIGCNRGMVGFEFANNGAALVHGVDNYQEGIDHARDMFAAAMQFADIRYPPSRFEVVDLTIGAAALDILGKDAKYDIVLMLATYHKLARVMSADRLAGLMERLGRMTGGWFAWRATSEDHKANAAEMAELDRVLGRCELKRIHTSYISYQLGVAAIWRRQC